MKILSYLFIIMCCIGPYTCFGAAAPPIGAPEEPVFIEKKRILWMDDPINVRLAAHAKAQGVHIPLGTDPKVHFPDMGRMPPPFPRLADPFQIMALAREGESAGSYFWAMKAQMTAEALESRDVEGQTVLLKVINNEEADFYAFSVLMLHPGLFWIPDADGVLPIFAAIVAEKECPQKYPYGVEILKTIAIASLYGRMNFLTFCNFIRTTTDPVSEVSLHDALMALPDESFTRATYECMMHLGREKYLKLIGAV